MRSRLTDRVSKVPAVLNDRVKPNESLTPVVGSDRRIRCALISGGVIRIQQVNCIFFCVIEGDLVQILYAILA